MMQLLEIDLSRDRFFGCSGDRRALGCVFFRRLCGGDLRLRVRRTRGLLGSRSHKVDFRTDTKRKLPSLQTYL